MFGSMVQGPIEEVTPTHLTMGVLSTLRQADYLAHAVLERHSKKVHNYRVVNRMCVWVVCGLA